MASTAALIAARDSSVDSASRTRTSSGRYRGPRQTLKHLPESPCDSIVDGRADFRPHDARLLAPRSVRPCELRIDAPVERPARHDAPLRRRRFALLRAGVIFPSGVGASSCAADSPATRSALANRTIRRKTAAAPAPRYSLKYIHGAWPSSSMCKSPRAGDSDALWPPMCRARAWGTSSS